MQCPEYVELERLYASAARRWAQYAHPQELVEPGPDQLQRATAIRMETLVERNCAADSMHLHRQNCRLCRAQEAD